jgi:RNase H-fold protein (predicted Holliday junction resolvase)
MGTRKNESGGKTVSRKTAQSALPVPDFKALHAAQETRDALRKEQIARVYPLRIELNTDSRAKEREKFDEMIRERERENERALEERKREKEAEEEREIREMRKKAVPKAHEVPGWYREAPRKKDMASASAKSLFLTG